MCMLFENLVDAVGYTPLIKLKAKDDQGAAIYAKLEAKNPGGSVKDRAAKFILQDLMDRGLLEVGGTVVESTSGNTGIALAMLGAAMGIHVVIVMPETMSVERRQLMRAYGAEVVLTPGSGGMKLAGEKAQEIAKEKNAPIFGQFTNEANVKAHEQTTAQEILSDLPNIDGFVAGIGTGGTVTGVGKILKVEKPEAKIWAVEPKESPLLTEGQAGSHKIQGLGANFIPQILDQGVLDKVHQVASEDAIQAAVALAKEQGILAGFSSGANYLAALALAKELGPDKNVVVVFPDTGERYLSTGRFGEVDGE
ncbi:cysteine synthase A [Hutsoniella sourekii]